jgi:WD40 repeat protein
MLATHRFTIRWLGRRAGHGLSSRPSRRRWSRAWAAEFLEDRTLLSAPDYRIAACVGPTVTSGSPVLIYSATGNAAPTLLSAIPLNAPTFPAFEPTTGELFVANNFGSDGGDVSRFSVDAAGNYTPNGTITGNGVAGYMTGIAFHDGELFANNYFSGAISRFKFDAQGNPIPNGTIAVSTPLLGVAFAPSGELFATTYTTIYRYLIDSTTGAAIPHGTIADPGSGGIHGIAFSPDGDLFAAEHSDNSVLRFSFDTSGNAVLDQSIAVHGAIGVAVSPSGELLVTEAAAEGGSITGFLPDASGNYAFNWSIPSDANSDVLYGIAIEPTATTHLVVTAQPPDSVIAGSTFGLTVTAKDSSGNVDSSFAGTVSVALAASPGGATLGGTLTATANSGVAVFSGLTLDKAGTDYTLRLSAAGLISGTTTAVKVTPATASKLLVTTQPPSHVTTASSFGFVVAAEDPYGNVDSNFGGSVAVALLNNPTGATLGGTLSVMAHSGVASFSGLTLDKVGTGYTLRVSTNGLTMATTSDFNVQPVPDYLIAATVTMPGGDPAYSWPVLLFGANGNHSPTPLSVIPPGPETSLHTPSNAAFNPATGELFITNAPGNANVIRFWVDAAGNYTPDGTITGNGLATGTNGLAFHDGELFADNYFTGAISRFEFDAQGAPIPNGTISVATGLIGAAFSPNGELFANTNSTIYRYLIDPATGSAVPDGTIADPGPGRLHYLAFSPNGDLFAASLDDNRVLRFSFDSNGNAVLDQSISVDQPIGVAVSPSRELLVSTHGNGIGKITSFLPDSNGNYAFNWSVPSDANSDSLGGIAIFPTAATNLVVTAQPPASVTAGSTFDLTVKAEDSSGNVDGSFNGTVIVALDNPGGAVLGGTLTATANSGVAVFSGLTLDKAGTDYTLRLSAAGLISGTTTAVKVTPATASKLLVTTQPPSHVATASSFGFVVAAEDPYGNVDSNFGGSVAVALLNNPTGATLGGTLSVMAHSGVASFSGLTLDKPGVGYTLKVSANILTSATTSAFNVQTTIATVAVDWGSQTVALQTAADGLRLLPVGRNTDLPWLGVQQVAITLGQATTVAAGDVTIKSARGVRYGPVTISGSGTSYLITLAQPISAADRVTLTIGNALIASFTCRLDVLPGDFNDDGVVDSRDVVSVRNEFLGFAGAVPTLFGDINGDGKVDINDYNAVRKLLFTTLPPIV